MKPGQRRTAPVCTILCFVSLIGGARRSLGQAASDSSGDLSAKVQQLNDAIVKAQSRLEESQRELNELREQMLMLQQQVAGTSATQLQKVTASVETAPKLANKQEMQEHESMQDSQLATLQQSKVESDSRYPISISGLILLNGFVNAEDVDSVTAPTLALPGAGNTGLTVRQTVLGVDARGPHLFGATSYADLRMDFAGSPSQAFATGLYSSSYGVSTSFLRLRTAHAGLVWPHTEAYFALDRPVFNPESPTSLAAVAEPALSWSGNLWMWNPQAGVRWHSPAGETGSFSVNAAFMDVADAPLTPQYYAATKAQGPNTNEFSRWPGVEARVGWANSSEENSNRVGVGGFFAAHHYPSGRTLNSWAVTMDTHIRLPARLEFAGSFYRGLGLGGLGGGAYKDYAFRSYGGYADFNALDDVGGWAELKERINQRLQFNAAYGTDQLFAGQLRPFAPVLTTVYQRLARNGTFTANTIYSPSAYLLFSLEYRHITSAPIVGAPPHSNVVALSAGYKF